MRMFRFQSRYFAILHGSVGPFSCVSKPVVHPDDLLLPAEELRGLTPDQPSELLRAPRTVSLNTFTKG